MIGLIFLASAPAGQWLGGKLIDRLRGQGIIHAPHLVLAGCATLCMLPAAIFCMAAQQWVSAAAYAVFNFLVFFATPAGLTGWQCLTPQRFRGVLIALLVSVVTLVGVGLGPYLVGTLTEHVFRSEQVLGQALLLIIAGAGTLGVALALAGRRPFSRAMHLVASSKNEADSRTSSASP